MQPLVIEYLRKRSFQQLEEEHGVKARPNSDGTKFSLNYDALLASRGDLLSEQCRGLVIRPTQWNWAVFKDDWKFPTVGECEVMAWPMNRFYNHGDGPCAEIDWSDKDLKVYEKLDGTMMVVYWDSIQGRWHAGTRAVSEADLPISAGSFVSELTFSDLFFQALRATREASDGQIKWEVNGFDNVVHLNKELTYVFELTSPTNRVVVKYDEPRVTLIAARHTKSGEEIRIEDVRLQHVNRPKTWDLSSASAIDAFVQQADPSQLEGIVVCDSRFNRAKVKNKAWILSSRAKDLLTVSRRSALVATIMGTSDDVIPLVEKDIAASLRDMQDQVRRYMTQVDDRFKTFKTEALGSRKAFAEQVMLTDDWTYPYFQMWQGNFASAIDCARSLCERDKMSVVTLDVILGKLKQLP